MRQPLHFAAFQGRAIEQVFLPLAQLRMEVFRAYPYLYEGSIEYETEYLQTYSNAERALLFTAFSGEQMIGATTCIPLSDETAAVQKPFVESGYDVQKVFLLPLLTTRADTHVSSLDFQVIIYFS